MLIGTCKFAIESSRGSVVGSCSGLFVEEMPKRNLPPFVVDGCSPFSSPSLKTDSLKARQLRGMQACLIGHLLRCVRKAQIAASVIEPITIPMVYEDAALCVRKKSMHVEISVANASGRCCHSVEGSVVGDSSPTVKRDRRPILDIDLREFSSRQRDFDVVRHRTISYDRRDCGSPVTICELMEVAN